MGKLAGIHRRNRKRKYEFDTLKIRHREADTVYRTKVQYIYGKLREVLKSTSTKDEILIDALSHIEKMETILCEAVGHNHLKIFKEEFINFLPHEENVIWKKGTNLAEWWSEVEYCLDESNPSSTVSANDPLNCKRKMTAAVHETSLSGIQQNYDTEEKQDVQLTLAGNLDSSEENSSLEPFRELRRKLDSKKSSDQQWQFPNIYNVTPFNCVIEEGIPMSQESNSTVSGIPEYSPLISPETMLVELSATDLVIDNEETNLTNLF